MYGGIFYIARDGVDLSKGKYKLKISPTSKNNALNLDGKIAMMNNGSRTIKFNKNYITAVVNGKKYKFKFKLDEKATVLLSNTITSYAPDEIFPFVPDYKIVNSKGKTVVNYNRSNLVPNTTLEKGTYTLEVKANETGYLDTKIGK